MPDTSSKPNSQAEAVKTEQGVMPAAIVAETDPAGRSEPDPTRYGDWEKNGRCIDF